MGKVKELIGEDIKMAYDGNYLSEDFGYSCANYNISYGGFNKGFNLWESYGMKSNQGNDLRMFDVFTKNPKNISCFVYYNDDEKIAGRRMFFKGKQLLDDKVFPITTKLGEEIYYLYGYYGEHNREIQYEIEDFVLNKYSNAEIIYEDHGFYYNGNFINKKSYFIMEIERMDFNIYPPVDFLQQCPELKAYMNFKPSIKIKEWLKETYKKDELNIGAAYRYEKGGRDIKHWNRKYLDD